MTKTKAPATSHLVAHNEVIILEQSRNIFTAQWEELLYLRREVLKRSDQDDIHDLRVASRRFRAELGLLAPFTASEPATELRKNIRKLTRVLGGLRNMDEALLFFQSHTTGEASVNNQLRRILSEERTVELARIHKELKNFKHQHLDRLVREMASDLKEYRNADGKNISMLAYFSNTSINLFQSIHDLLPISTVHGYRESRHALRISIKKWRYFLEFVAQILDLNYSSILTLLKEYQSILGRMNDLVEFGLLCRSLSLPTSEREFVEYTLLAEDELLLEKFTEFIQRNPLSYTFLI